MIEAVFIIIFYWYNKECWIQFLSHLRIAVIYLQPRLFLLSTIKSSFCLSKKKLVSKCSFIVHGVLCFCFVFFRSVCVRIFQLHSFFHSLSKRWVRWCDIFLVVLFVVGCRDVGLLLKGRFAREFQLFARHWMAKSNGFGMNAHIGSLWRFCQCFL